MSSHLMWSFRSVLVGAFLMLIAAQAGAQDFGVRVGGSVDPDQLYFGAHAEGGPLVDRVWFRPNVEVGVGDDLTTTAVNFEFVYKFPSRKNPFSLYAGGGPAINFFRFNGNTETEGGFNVLLGAEHVNGFFGEVKIGGWDSPDLKFGVGYTFR